MRRRLRLAGIALVALLLVDVSRPPMAQVTARVMIASIELYQRGVSDWLSRAGVNCRFRPTCSRYAIGALRKYGTVGGSWRTGRRLIRCGPWTPAGTSDPP